MFGMGSLWIGNSGLSSSSNAINVTANNLTNINTDGYVRQQVTQGDKEYITLKTNTAGVSNITTGLGVTISEVEHTRDIFLDKYYRSESGRQSFYSTMYDAVSEIETTFQELEGEAFQDSLEDFWQAFAEFEKDPSSSTNQNLVIQKASLFITRSQAVKESLTDYQTNLNNKVTDMVDSINDIGSQIDELNKKIAKIEAGGVETAYDLRDERDLLLDDLSSMCKTSYKELANGTLCVSIEGVSFVDEGGVHEMDTVTDPSSGLDTPVWKELSNYETGEYADVYDLSIDISTTKNTDIGELKALVLSRGDAEATYLDELGLGSSDLTNLSPVMSAMAQIDNLVNTIVTSVNNTFSPLTTVTDDSGNTYTVWDSTGCTGSDGTGPGQELFSRLYTDRYTEQTLTVDGETQTYYVYNEENASDSTSLYTIDNLEVNQNLLANETLIPYLATDGSVSYTLASTLSGLWDQDFDNLGGCTYKEYYNSIIDGIADVGTVYNSVSTTLSSAVSSIVNQRDSVIGVSSDEELSNMIKYQSAYNAASRYINVISDMLETIVTMV